MEKYKISSNCLKYFFLLILFFWGSAELFGKYFGDPQYCIISFNGEILLKGTDQKWKALKIGDLIEENDIIKIRKNLHVTIFDRKNEQYIIIHGERTIKIKDAFQNTGSSSPKSIVDVILKAFNDFTNVFRSSVTESQEKTKLRSSFSQQKIISISPRKSKVFSEDIKFRWVKSDVDTNYRFLLLSEDFKVVLDTILNEDFFDIKKSGRKLERGQEYIWRVYYGKDVKEFKELSVFRFVNEDEFKFIKKNLDSLDNIIEDKNSPVYFALKGILFEGQLFYAEALENYFNAIKLDPKDIRYENLINKVFEKMNLNFKYSDLFNH